MLADTESAASSDVWVEVRVDDGNSDVPPRHIVVYVGRVRAELLQAWTRIEHGECWFLLDDVLWYEEDPASPAPPPRSSWVSSVLGGAPDEAPAEGARAPEYRTLIRQSEKARYWGYADRMYLRLDRVYRITPLAREYVEQAVLPALRRSNAEPTADGHV